MQPSMHSAKEIFLFNTGTKYSRQFFAEWGSTGIRRIFGEVKDKSLTSMARLC